MFPLLKELCEITKVNSDRALESEARVRQESDSTSDGGLWKEKIGLSPLMQRIQTFETLH